MNINNILSTISILNKKRGIEIPNFFKKVKEVIIIASSSRGGSSLFLEILRQSPELIHFRAENTPFLVLSGLTYPKNNLNSDALTEIHTKNTFKNNLYILEKEMCLDSGSIESIFNNDFNRFSNDLLWRIVVQWPFVKFDLNLIQSLVLETLNESRQNYDSRNKEIDNLSLFHLILLKKINHYYPEINPYYYDINPELVNLYFNIKSRFGPPSPFLIEEPPFISIYPRKPLTENMLKKFPLVIKTPSNAYRLNFFKNIFQNAKFRVLHLVRNPAAAINGLYDGWQYKNGFFSHKVLKTLNIIGYSELFSWGKYWWKFDLPPNWEEWTHQRLENVCGFQWYSAHNSVLDFLDKNQVDYFRLKFEDVIGSIETKKKCINDLAIWLNIDPTPLIKYTCSDLPITMATNTPVNYRWMKKFQIITNVLTIPEIKKTTQKIGYDFNIKKWI